MKNGNRKGENSGSLSFDLNSGGTVYMRSKRFSWLYSLIAIWGGGIGCADKIDPSLLDTSLRDAQNIILDTRLSGAEEYAGE